MNSIANTADNPMVNSQPAVVGLMRRFIALCGFIPHSAISFLARFSIASVFWKSGQTKIQGFGIDLVNREFVWGWPSLSDSALA